MPVIERSAAILEPCSLHKTLTTVRTARQLHAAFWRHGAAELELLSTGQILPGDLSSTLSDAGPGRPDGPMMASILPFDFLYSQSSGGLLQRLYFSPIIGIWEQSERLRRHGASSRLDARAYSIHASKEASENSTRRHEQDGTKAQDRSMQQTAPNSDDRVQNGFESDDSFLDYLVSRASNPKDSHRRSKSKPNPDWFKECKDVGTGAPKDLRHYESSRSAAKNPSTQPQKKASTNQAKGSSYYPTLVTERVVSGLRPVRVDPRHFEQAVMQKKETGVSAAALERDLQSASYSATSKPTNRSTQRGTNVSHDTLDRLWQEFQTLSPEQQHSRVPGLVIDLSDSQRLADNWRIIQIFPQIRKMTPEGPRGDRQTAAHVRAVIRAYYALQDSAAGMKIYKSWIKEGRRPVGFGCPAAELIKAAQWPGLAELWQEYLDHNYTPNSRFQKKSSEVSRFERRQRIMRSLEVEETEVEYMLAIPDLKDKLLQLYDYVYHEDTSVNQKETLSSFLLVSLRWVLQQLKLQDALRIVQETKDPRLSEDFIQMCVQRRQLALATQVYLGYRLLPGPGPVIPVLKLLINEIFLPQKDVQKMELVLQDWLRRHPRLTVSGYKLYLGLYAATGDVASFKRIYNMFAREYSHAVWLGAYDLLTLHRNRGETAMVRQVFDEMESRYNRKPEINHWNLLLSAHQRDQNATLEIFADLCEAVEPNETSFTIMIKVLGRRGDLQLVRELHQMALDRGVKMTARSREGFIDAFCLNDMFDEAEKTCKGETSAAKHKESRAKVVCLWNRLIKHYAVRRDIVSIHRILNAMEDMNVSYDSNTYYYLMQALSYTGQVHHALQLVRAAYVDGLFEPTTKHFLLLMSGFIQNGETYMVPRIDELLTKSGLPKSSGITLRRILALLEDEKGSQLPDGTLPPGDNFRQAISNFADFLKEHNAGQVKRPSINPQDIGHLPPELFSSLLFYAVTVRRNKAAADKLLEVYRAQKGYEEGGSQFGHVKMLASILNYEAYQRDIDDVVAIWETLFKTAREAGRSAAVDLAAVEDVSSQRSASSQIVPAWKFVLAEPLKTMQRLFEARGDVSALKALVQSVRAVGFELTGPNWNHYIQGLARMGEWREAFTLCERVLMPQWRGWAMSPGRTRAIKTKLPIEIRRMGSRLDYRRPTSYTILELGRHYRELINLGPWSREADELLGFIRAQCPELIRAISNHVGSMYAPEEIEMVLSGAAAQMSKIQWEKRKDEFKAEDSDSSRKEALLLDGLFAEEQTKNNKDATATASTVSDPIIGKASAAQQASQFSKLAESVSMKKPRTKTQKTKRTPSQM